MEVLLDTNFLIGLWRQPGAAGRTAGPEARYLAVHPDTVLGIPWIVKAEFLAGAVVAGHPLERVALFLAHYPVVWADETIVMHYASLYAKLRHARARVGPNDLWIGAAALAHGVPLLTRNVRELSRIEGLRIIAYADAAEGNND